MFLPMCSSSFFRTVVCLCVTLMAFGSQAMAQQAFSKVQFLPSSNSVCSEAGTPEKVLDDGSALLVPVDANVLEVGQGTSGKTTFSCSFKVTFRTPLTSKGTVQIDFYPSLYKEARSRLTFEARIGSQTHRFDFQPGRIIDPANNPTQLVRVQLMDLAKGATSFRIKIAGSAQSIDGLSAAQLGLDSINVCNVEPLHPEFCGSPVDKPKLPQ